MWSFSTKGVPKNQNIFTPRDHPTGIATSQSPLEVHLSQIKWIWDFVHMLCCGVKWEYSSNWYFPMDCHEVWYVKMNINSIKSMTLYYQTDNPCFSLIMQKMQMLVCCPIIAYIQIQNYKYNQGLYIRFPGVINVSTTSHGSFGHPSWESFTWR